MFAENLAGFLADFGETAVIGGVPATVIFDMPGSDILGNRVATDNFEITFITSLFPALVFGTTVLLRGVNYTVNNIDKIDDGAFSKATLQTQVSN